MLGTLLTEFNQDPIILSGTAFLAYMTRVSENIDNPRAWIYTQFTVANIGSAILVSLSVLPGYMQSSSLTIRLGFLESYESCSRWSLQDHVCCVYRQHDCTGHDYRCRDVAISSLCGLPV